MFDQLPKADTDKNFPDRKWIGISCANPGCLNYARTDIDYLKAGQYKGRQRYKCKQCKKTFYRLDPPKERLKINRTSENEEQVKPNHDSNMEEPKQKPPKRKKLSFLLTYKAIQGLHEVCNSLGIDDCRELLEQIGWLTDKT